MEHILLLASVLNCHFTLYFKDFIKLIWYQASVERRSDLTEVNLGKGTGIALALVDLLIISPKLASGWPFSVLMEILGGEMVVCHFSRQDEITNTCRFKDYRYSLDSFLPLKSCIAVSLQKWVDIPFEGDEAPVSCIFYTPLAIHAIPWHGLAPAL